MAKLESLVPGSTIGILGGGQLGRMLAMAAAQLGYRCHIYAPEENSPATDVAAEFTQAKYDDGKALARFIDAVDVVTFEFENVPVNPLGGLVKNCTLFPSTMALETAQDRISEKTFAQDLGARTAPFAYVSSKSDLADAMEEAGVPAIMKTTRLGYDGKGQVRIYDASEALPAWHEIGKTPAIVEGFVDFEQEFSVLLARGRDGEIRFWDCPHNVHEDGILATSTLPAGDLIGGQVEEARSIATKIAEALEYVGVLTLEFFASAGGPVFNEMAPRVHNSGHWTIEGARTSQFENHIRAICGLPLGDTALAGSRVEMTNLIGGDADRWKEFLSDPANHLHLYGKGEAREGRKMGHVTRVTY